MTIVWGGHRARPFVPTLLADRALDARSDTATRLGRAAAAVEQGAAAMHEDHVVLDRLLLRSEGIASWYVEGVQAPVVDVVLSEAGDATDATPARWVAGNLAAVMSAIDEATEAPLTVATLRRWYATLMAGRPVPAGQVGVVRSGQGWIGGTSPLHAHLVTPAPDQVPALIDDLVAYANESDHGPIAQAAVAHAPFELIHPFADGNGRIGRVLIAWIRWFADVVAGASWTQVDLVASLGNLPSAWTSRLDGVRRDAAWRVLDLIPRLVLLTAPTDAEELAIPLKSASAALRTLTTAGVVTEHGTVAGTAYRASCS